MMYAMPSPPMSIEAMREQDEKVKALIVKIMGAGRFSLTAGSLVTLAQKQ